MDNSVYRPAIVTDIAILYEHPLWFIPLFDVLDRRGIAYARLETGAGFDPAAPDAPAPLILNRVAMSAFLRQAEHPIFWTLGLLDRWERTGARVLNGTVALAIDTSKARQLSLLASLGLATPRTRVMHRTADVTAAEPATQLRAAAEAIARAAGLDLGGVELMIDDRDGTPRFYDINALSNFVARPLDVLGWDPHDRLADRLVGWIAETR